MKIENWKLKIILLKKITFIVLIVFFFSLQILFANASGNLIKTADNSAVYYLASNGVRHLFPTENTYKSWYKDFSDILVIDDKEMADYSLGKNITVRPGVKIISFDSDNNYYAVGPGGVIRPFDDIETIREIYGLNWQKRIINLPVGFFDNYVMGEEIKRHWELPDGFVYKLSSDGNYYYKENKVLWRFKDRQAVTDNGYQMSDVAESDISWPIRQREIIGKNKNIFNPIKSAIKTTNDCENKNLKAAFILVAKNDYTAQQIEKINRIKRQAEKTFHWATREMATLDTAYPLIILTDDGYLLEEDETGQLVPSNETINTFYDNNADIFDFIFLYNNFVLNEELKAKYLTVTNDFLGTGNSIMHTAHNFGSGGKLKGIANMGNINKYDTDTNHNLNQAVNYALHEILHQWSGRAKFVDDQGEVSYDLLTEDKSHYNMYVNAISPLGGNGWVDNGNGTYTNRMTLLDEPGKRPFSDLDLYFMGLVPKPYVPAISYLVPEKAGDVGNVLSGELKTIAVDQIEQAMGKWRCRAQ